MKKNKKIVRYRKKIHINIGVVMFAFVLIYFLIYLISYLTANHIAVYEVQRGQITQNTTYTGLALRSEQIFETEEDGEINYYRKDGDKVGVRDLICSVDKDGEIAEQINEAGQDGTKLSSEDLSEIQNLISDYTSSYSGMQFYNIYSFKEGVNSKIQEELYTKALEDLSAQTKAAVSKKTFSMIRASEDGTLAFYTDGYESVTADNFSADQYQPSSYEKINLKTKTSVASGEALYKIVDKEDWQMLVPLTEDEVKHYRREIEEDADSFVIRVLFKKDDCAVYATASIKNYDGQDFLLLQFNNSMIRYLADRYLEVELGSDAVTGLKIPNSAITVKEFLFIPKEYITKGGDSAEDGVIKITYDKNNRENAEFIPTDLYRETDSGYYVAEDDLSVGDTIRLPESTKQLILRDTRKLKGVFNVNRGYAVFKLIDILTQNEEYSIIKSGSDYGIAMYDHLALDGSSVKEGEMVH